MTEPPRRRFRSEAAGEQAGDGHGRVQAVDPAEHERVLSALGALAADPDPPARRAVAEQLVTDAAAILLALEREHLLVKRRSRTVLLEAERSAEAAREAQHLAAREVRLERDIAELRRSLARMRRRFAPGM